MCNRVLHYVAFVHKAYIALCQFTRIAVLAKGETNITLTSTLKNGEAFDGQRITITCVTRGSVILDWLSDEYIGISKLQILTVTEANSPVISNSNRDTIAWMIRVTNEDSDQIRALHYCISTVPKCNSYMW